jgi:hypothetical protein
MATWQLTNKGFALDLAHSIDYWQFNTEFVDSSIEGRLQWNADDGTLEYGLPGGNVTLQIGQEQLVKCVNETGSTINDGDVVYVASASGSRPSIALASSAIGTGNVPIGMATEDIEHLAQGYVNVGGLVRGIDTSAIAAGSVGFLSESAPGALRATPPDAPNYTTVVGYCLFQSAESGIFLVRVLSAPRLVSLSDTLAAAPNNGELYRWVAGNSRFELGDHGDIPGLTDDDHTQYILVTDLEADRATINSYWEDLTDGGETELHTHAGGGGGGDLLADGSVPLTSDWDAGEFTISVDTISATGATGLRLSDDSDTLGIFIQDGGLVGVGTATPQYSLCIKGAYTQVRIGSADANEGLFLLSTAPGQGIITQGVTWDGSDYYARHTNVTLFQMVNGYFYFYSKETVEKDAVVVLDEAMRITPDGDTEQAGFATMVSLMLGTTPLSESDLGELTDAGETALHSHAAGGGDLLADGTVPMTADWPFGNYALYIGDTANTKMTSPGLTINMGAGTLECISLKSSDITHGITSETETDTWGVIKKISNTAGGIRITGYSETGVNIAALYRGVVADEVTTKTTGSQGAVYLSGGKKSGTSFGNMSANANILVVANNSTTRFIVDAEGDTWQGGLATMVSLMLGTTPLSESDLGELTEAGQTALHSHAAGGGDLLADGSIPMTADWTFGNYALYIGDTENANLTIGVTINQGANDDQLFALKSSDIAHGRVTNAETDTFFALSKANAEFGGVHMLVLGEDVPGHPVVFVCSCIGGTAQTTKTTAGRSLYELNIYEHDGADSITNITSGGNAFGIRCQSGGSAKTRWILGEDGATWQSGGATILGNVIISPIATPEAASITAELLILGDETDPGALVIRETSNDVELIMLSHFSEHGILGMSSNHSFKIRTNNTDRMHFDNSGVVFIGDKLNAKMTKGLTINQGANDDEILSFKSSDVAHGMTDKAETDTYGHFRKASADTGGLQIKGYTENNSAIVLVASVTVDETTKSTSGIGALRINANKKSGAGSGDLGANSNILSLENNGSARWIADSDGDTWQSGGITTGAAKSFINDTLNANMTIGLTINQGASDDEILALKSSDVAHALVAEGETDTYLSFKKRVVGEGGTRITSIMGDTAANRVLQFNVYGGTAVNDKTKDGWGLVNFFVAEHDGANSNTNITADGIVLGITGWVGGSWRTLFMVDENGDYFYDGANGGAYDDYEDAQLVRALSLATSKDVIRSQWDEAVQYNEASLVEAGILGASVAEGGLVNGAQLQRLHSGAIWQLYQTIQTQALQIESLESKLKLLEM